MKFLVSYVLVAVGVCLWALTRLLRDEDQQITFSQQFGNKGTSRALVLIALLSGLFWPLMLTIRILTTIIPARWFFTKNDDDDEPPPPNQENAV